MKFYVFKVPYIADSQKNTMTGGIFLSELSACRWQLRALPGRCFASFFERQEDIPCRIAKLGLTANASLRRTGSMKILQAGLEQEIERIVREAEVGETEVVCLQS